MSLRDLIKQLLIYQGPKPYDQFELLEDQYEEQTPRKPEQGWRFKIKGWLKSKPLKIDGAAKEKQDIAKKLQINLARIKEEFHFPTNDGLIIREFKILGRTDAFIAFLDGIVDNNFINNYVLKQLLSETDTELASGPELLDYISDNLLATELAALEHTYAEAVKWILEGKTALFVDNCQACILVETTQFEKRAISTPLTEMVVKGPQEAFVEDLRSNVGLIRKILRNRNLVTEHVTVTEANQMACALIYIKNIVNPAIVEEARRRLQGINVDFISDGTLENLIEDHPYALFPQILSTERPDRVASFLMEGRVAIIFEGTPAASVAPMTFAHFLHTPEDFYLRWQYGTFLRLIRFLALFFAIFPPGLYLALTLYHQEAIPVGLLTTIIRTRENLPFPAPVELLFMEVAWELIREAGVRVPGIVGQTLGIIGGVILGQAAVAAGLVSPILIIVVAITGLGNFAIPNFPVGFGVRILRFLFLALGWLAGLYGIALGILALGALICSMKSFGVPFFSPMAPKTKGGSVLLRKPVWLEKEKPDSINPKIKEKTKSTVRGWASKQGQGGDKPQ